MAPKPIFITARFRSGSTLLWNIFRHMPNCMALYEPCNDLLLDHIKQGNKALSTHRNVTSYWDEYLPVLNQVESQHCSDFGLTKLFLESHDNYPEMGRYIKGLLGLTKDNIPVLQFNRMDFRLGWLRKQFPDAKIIHLTRNPRDSWYSMVRDLPEDAWKDPFSNTNYDLLIWSISLYHNFPLLFSPKIKTSYHRHFILWKLSNIMGKYQADLTLDFDEDLLENSNLTIQRLAEFTERTDVDVDKITELVVPPECGLWKELASPEWFKSVEKQCNSLLNDLGLLKNFGKMPLKKIQDEYRPAWNSMRAESLEIMSYAATLISGLFRKEYLDISFLHRKHCLEFQENTLNFETRFEQENDKCKSLMKQLEESRKDITKQAITINQWIKEATELQKQTEVLKLEEKRFENQISKLEGMLQDELTDRIFAERVLDQTRKILSDYESKLLGQ